MTPKHLLLLSLCVLAACGGGSKPEPTPTPDPTPAGCDATGLTVTLVSPPEPVTTRGTVQVSLSVSGQADTVEVLRDGVVLATLAAPYTYAWDTTSVLEGGHELQGRATCGTTRVTSAVQTVVVDRTPPALTGRTPGPDAEAAAGSAIRLDFSEPLLPSSVTASSVVLTVEGQRREATVALSADGRALTLTPAQPLLAPARAEVMLAEGLTDAVGNAVAPPAPWAFTVPRWLAAPGAVPPARAGESFASLPILQLDVAGQPVVAFRAASGPTASAVTRTARWTGSAWTPLLEAGGGEALAFGFAMGPEDRVMFAELRHPGDRSLDMEFHMPGKDPKTDFIFDCEDPVAAMGPGGTGAVACAYALSGVPPYSLFVETFGPGGPVELPEVPGLQAEEDQRRPGLALDGGGRPFVAFVNGSGGVQLALWTGARWLLIPNPFPTKGLVGELAVRTGVAGQLFVAWREVEGSESRVSLLRYGPGNLQPFPVPSDVALPPDGSPSVALAVDAENNPVLAWTEAGTPAKVRVARYDNVNGWVSLGEVSRPGADVLLGRGGLELDAQAQPVLATVVRAGGASEVQVWRLNVPAP